MSVLRVTRSVYDAIRAHGEETYPHECCGALLGTRGDGRLADRGGGEGGATRAPIRRTTAIRLHRRSWSRSSVRRGAKA